MYYPYLRGKQYELILLRENAELIATNNMNPIIEPVKLNTLSLRRAIEVLIHAEAEFTVVVNPKVGELKDESEKILEVIEEIVPEEYGNMSIAYIVDANTELDPLCNSINETTRNNCTLIHYGYTDGQGLARQINTIGKINTHIFIDGATSTLYQRHFRNVGNKRVLIRDGFTRRRNEDYPMSEHFSDLHITHDELNIDDFGDFLIVGDEYRETGGPAYAVALHLTYLGEEEDMFINHYVSDQRGSWSNPAGKFMEALAKLITDLNSQDTMLFESEACSEYRRIFEEQHFPGLGYVKKLSMQHHLELIALYLREHSS